MSVIILPVLSDVAKFLLPLIVYCFTDYHYSSHHYRNRFQHPIPAYYAAFSHSFLLLFVTAITYLLTRTVPLPRITIKSFATSSTLSLLLRYGVFDLNHNFGVPACKVVTAVLLPLILLAYKSDRKITLGAFGTMLVSTFIGSHRVPVNQMFLGMFLSAVAFVCLGLLEIYVEENESELDNLSQDSKLHKVLSNIVNIVAGIALFDMMMIYFDSNTTEYNHFGSLGVILFAMSSLGLLLLLYTSVQYAIIGLMLSWVLKTLMYSMTFTLMYKFDMTVSNLLAVLTWVVYLVGVRCSMFLGKCPK